MWKQASCTPLCTRCLICIERRVATEKEEEERRMAAMSSSSAHPPTLPAPRWPEHALRNSRLAKVTSATSQIIKQLVAIIARHTERLGFFLCCVLISIQVDGDYLQWGFPRREPGQAHQHLRKRPNRNQCLPFTGGKLTMAIYAILRTAWSSSTFPCRGKELQFTAWPFVLLFMEWLGYGRDL